MKTTKAIIMSCALAAGLVAFAPQSQAGVVIGDSLYAPASFKMTYSYVDAKGKVQKVSLKNKDVLGSLGANYYNFPKGTQLAYGSDGDIYAISKSAELADLSADGYIFVNTSSYSSQEIPGKNGAYKYAETGLIEVGLFSDDNGFGDNYYDFEVSGTYSVKYSQTADSKKFIYGVTESVTTSTLIGEGYDNDLSGDAYPVTGTVSASGSGKLVD